MTGLQTIVESRSPEQTLEIGRQIGRKAAPGLLVVLEGELGTGKTVLARGIAEGLGIDEWRGSPTFNLIHEYQGRLPFHHVDAYRLASVELVDLDIDALMTGQGVVAIEWGERFLPELLSFKTPQLMRVYICHVRDGLRRIELRP